MTALFWLLIALLGLTYFGYPASLVLLRKVRAHIVGTKQFQSPVETSVDLILPVHNEEGNLPRKLANIQSLTSPRELLRVFVVSDGSTDGTEAIVRTAAKQDDRINLIVLPTQGGKEVALNAAVQAGTSPIVAFTDASLMMESDSLQHLVDRFEDPMIGCVSGEDFVGGENAEGLYGRYELSMRRNESAIHSIVGASGCLYAQRRSLCRPFKPGLAPDFYSVLETVRQGYRAVCEPDARGHMPATETSSGEFQRKTRTILRGIATLAECRELLNPLRYGIFSYMLWGHKVLRWLVPIWQILLLVVSLILSAAPVYLALLIGQLAFYTIGIMASYENSPVRGSSLGRIAGYLTISNAAALVALAKWIVGVEQTSWKPTNR